MKIKFLKPFRLYNPVGDDMMMGEGAIENMKEDYAEWLIDNGFAKEVIESGWWKPKNGETYYFIDGDGTILYDKYKDTFYNKCRVSVGNCFKTYFAADKCRDYWEAIATVRQDEGVMTPKEVESADSCGGTVWCITYTFDSGFFVHTCHLAMVCPQIGAIYFNSRGYAQASLDKHQDEWKIIANFDWSRE